MNTNRVQNEVNFRLIIKAAEVSNVAVNETTQQTTSINQTGEETLNGFVVKNQKGQEEEPSYSHERVGSSVLMSRKIKDVMESYRREAFTSG